MRVRLSFCASPASAAAATVGVVAAAVFVAILLRILCVE